MANSLIGKVVAIENVRSIERNGKEPFQTRRVLLDKTRFNPYTGERGREDVVMVDFSSKNVTIPDAFKAGDIVEIFFDLNGNRVTNDKGETSYFIHANGYRMERVVQQSQQTPAQPASQAPQPAPQQTAAPATPPAGFSPKNDGLPF